MKNSIALLTVLLLAVSCSYRSTTDRESGGSARDLSEMEERCVRNRLLTGWGLELKDVAQDLNPEEEIAVDIAIELCRLDPNGLSQRSMTPNDQPQVSEDLLAAATAFDPTDDRQATIHHLMRFGWRAGAVTLGLATISFIRLPDTAHMSNSLLVVADARTWIVRCC